MKGNVLRGRTTGRRDNRTTGRMGAASLSRRPVVLTSCFFVCACLALAGCKSVALRGTPIELTEEKRATLRAFPTTAFEMEQSVVFTLRGRDFAGMGVTRIEPDGSFASSCVTAQGMTLFEIAGQGERLDFCRVLPGMGDTEKVAAMFAECVRNVYFGNIPAPGKMWKLERGIGMLAYFDLPKGSKMRYFFYMDGRLFEKRIFTPRGKWVWVATYSDYDETGPRKIAVVDKTQRYPYKLNLRVTNWRVAGEEP